MQPFTPASGNDAWTLADLYLRRPTPEYAKAFDLIAARFNASEGRALIVLSSPAHAAELLKRCPRPLDVASADSFEADPFVQSARKWAWGPIRTASLNQNHEAYAALAWAEPEAHSALSVAEALRRRAAPNATLDVIASAPLRRYLPAWQTSPRPAMQPLNPPGVLRALRAVRWRIEDVNVFHGPRAILWSTLFRTAEWLGRPDWADRCLFAMRSNYREPGWLWPFAPLALIHAQAV